MAADSDPDAAAAAAAGAATEPGADAGPPADAAEAPAEPTPHRAPGTAAGRVQARHDRRALSRTRARRLPRPRHDGRRHGGQSRPGRLRGHGLEPHAGARPGARGSGCRHGRDPCGGRRRHGDRGHLRLRHPRRRGRPVRSGWRRRRRACRHPHRRLLDDRTLGQLGLRQAACGSRPVDGRCTGLRRQRRRQERDADDLRRRRGVRCRASAARPDGDGPDDHARRPDRCRSGGQGRQPGRSWPARTSASPRAWSSPSRPGWM